MHILVIDGHHVEAEFRAKFGPAHEYTFTGRTRHPSSTSPALLREIDKAIATSDVAFCFADPTNTDGVANVILTSSSTNKSFPVFTEIIWDPLMTINRGEAVTFFGFCGLPTLINRPLLEISIANEADREKLAETCAALGTDYRVVADRVGLVTPRVICQIINEACFTVQEGTATMADVDLGMKLGTNYPHGPFAWANAIGVARVYAVLEALWHDTHDERYKVCPLLKRQALRGEPFAV